MLGAYSLKYSGAPEESFTVQQSQQFINVKAYATR